MSRFSENHIENPAAYQDAIRRRIQANARKGKEQRWLAGREDRMELVERLQHAAFDRPGSFLAKMNDSFLEWGCLTEKQEAAVRTSFEKAEARKAEAKTRDTSSRHVGTVGERQDFTLTLRSSIEIESQFGLLVINIMADADGNVIIYKGRHLAVELSPGGRLEAQRGDAVTLKATVKAHADRDGVAQTVINRPKVVHIQKVAH